MAYQKTTWNNGAAPGISAEKLNKLETQYDEAKADLDAHTAAPDPHPQYAKDTDLSAHTGLTTTAHGGIVPSNDVTTVATANKILKLDSNAKLPASITGDAQTLQSAAPATTSTANTITKRDSSGDISVRRLISTISTGTSPFAVTSTTKTTNLNADFLDGYHAGNTSGAIPISNGTVNTNLNADTLDGMHASDFATTQFANSVDAVEVINDFIFPYSLFNIRGVQVGTYDYFAYIGAGKTIGIYRVDFANKLTSILATKALNASMTEINIYVSSTWYYNGGDYIYYIVYNRDVGYELLRYSISGNSWTSLVYYGSSNVNTANLASDGTYLYVAYMNSSAYLYLDKRGLTGSLVLSKNVMTIGNTFDAIWTYNSYLYCHKSSSYSVYRYNLSDLTYVGVFYLPSYSYGEVMLTGKHTPIYRANDDHMLIVTFSDKSLQTITAVIIKTYINNLANYVRDDGYSYYLPNNRKVERSYLPHYVGL